MYGHFQKLRAVNIALAQHRRQKNIFRSMWYGLTTVQARVLAYQFAKELTLMILEKGRLMEKLVEDGYKNL